jgi:hypothetical protein
MNHRVYTNAEMIAISAAWLDEHRHQPAFKAIPLLAGLIPQIETAHDGLAVLEAPDAEVQAAERELIQVKALVQDTDRIHDSKGRGVFDVLTSANSLADTEEEQNAILAVRNRIFPTGRDIFTQNYRAESGHAERAQHDLTDPSVRSVLKGIRVCKGRTLLDEANAYVKAGRQLGVYESRKVELETILASGPRGSVRSENLKARVEWIRTVSSVFCTAKLLKGDDAARFAAVARDYAAANAKASTRIARQQVVTEATAETTKPTTSSTTATKPANG